MSNTGSESQSVTGPIFKIAVGAIALSVIVMIVGLTTGMGLQHKIRSKVSDFNGHLNVHPYDLNRSQSQDAIDAQWPIDSNWLKDPRVLHWHRSAKKAGLLKTETDFEGVVLKGVDEKFNPLFFKEYLVDGIVPQMGLGLKSDSLMVSEALANTLQLSLGQKVAMYFFDPEKSRPKLRAMRVAGIFRTGLEDFDKKVVIGSIGQVQSINGWNENQIGSFEIIMKDFSQLAEFDEALYTALPYNYASSTILEEFPQLMQWVALFDTNMVVVLGIMVLVALVNIITALLIMILERRTMVGVLKALGASHWGIRKIFIFKSLQLSLKGLIIGNAIGLGFACLQYFTRWIALDESSYYVSYVPIYFSWEHLIGINALVLISCFLGLILPSMLISKIDPIKVIRFD